MKQVKKKKLSPVMQALIGVVMALVVAAAGWFLLVSPQRARAAKLDKEIVAVEEQVSAARTAQLQAADVQPIRAADLFRLTKAMPNDIDIAGVLLELSKVARESGITFKTIVPGATANVENFRVQPIELAFDGNFYSLSDFLFRLRKLVAVDNGRLMATGRLFSIEQVAFGEGPGGFPTITAGLKISAYLYGNGTTAGAPNASMQPAPGSPTTTGATTTPGATAPATTTPTDTTATTTTPGATTNPDTPPAAPSAAGAP